MKFRNPWIDPRIVELKVETARAYLIRTGWWLVGPAADPELDRFELPESPVAPTLFVPHRITSGAAVQWMIDLVADLARHEDRWAVDVLGEILGQSASGLSGNGISLAGKAEPAPSGSTNRFRKPLTSV